jgi:hypothetical protein
VFRQRCGGGVCQGLISGKTLGVRLIRNLLLILGIVAVLGGIGSFLYLSFFPRSEPQAFEPVPHSIFNLVPITWNGFCSLGFHYRYDADVWVRHGLQTSEPAYGATLKAKIVDDKGNVLLDRIVRLSDTDLLPRHGYGNLANLAMKGDAEHHITDAAARVRPRMNVTVTVERVTAKNDFGFVDNIDWYLTKGNEDLGLTEFVRFDLPTYCLEAAGGGIALLILSFILRAGSRRK